MEHCSKCKGKQVTGAKKILKIGLKTREASSEAASIEESARIKPAWHFVEALALWPLSKMFHCCHGQIR